MRLGRASALIGVGLAFAVLVAGCSAAEPAGTGSFPGVTFTPTNGVMQSDSSGSVTVQLEWLTGRTDSVDFRVLMDTHSVSLNAYNLRTLAVLRDDAGQDYGPIAWDPAGAGHHRSGTLRFAVPDSLKEGRTKYIEVLVRNVAGVPERTFKWQIW